MQNLIRTGIYFFIVAIIFQACENKGGTIEHKIKFTTIQNSLKSTEFQGENTYTQFGKFITSLTPKKFSAKMNVMMYQDNWDQFSGSTHMISYIDGHDNDPKYEISLYVDFSNNQETSYEPILYGTDIRDGIFEQKEVTFNYFYFVPYYFSQEFEVPEAYGEMHIMGNNGAYTIDSVTGKRWITVNQQPLMDYIFGYPNQQPFGFFFGNTDSTYIVNSECEEMQRSENYPNGGNRPMIRSNKFTPITVVMPTKGETIEMYSTISFNTEHLIQVYEGYDNIPYTSDDIFVYAPKYWERINVKIEVN